MTTYLVGLPSGEHFFASDQETLLVAAQRAGWLVPFGCRNGNCGACVARLVAGNVIESHHSQRDLTATDEILLCANRAGSDLQLALDRSPVPGSPAQVRRSFVTLVAVTPAPTGGWRLDFDLPPGRQPVPRPGQYLRWEESHGSVVSAEIDTAASTGRRLVAIAAAATACPRPCKGFIEWPLGAASPALSASEASPNGRALPAYDLHARR